MYHHRRAGRMERHRLQAEFASEFLHILSYSTQQHNTKCSMRKWDKLEEPSPSGQPSLKDRLQFVCNWSQVVCSTCNYSTSQTEGESLDHKSVSSVKMLRAQKTQNTSLLKMQMSTWNIYICSKFSAFEGNMNYSAYISLHIALRYFYDSSKLRSRTFGVAKAVHASHIAASVSSLIEKQYLTTSKTALRAFTTFLPLSVCTTQLTRR